MQPQDEAVVAPHYTSMETYTVGSATSMIAAFSDYYHSCRVAIRVAEANILLELVHEPKIYVDV